MCTKCLLELSDTFQTPGTSYRYFHCTNCRTKVSIRNQTILSHAHIGIRFFILLAYTFVPGTIAQNCQKIHEVNSKFIFGKLAKQFFGKSWEFGPTGLTPLPPPSPYIGIPQKEKKCVYFEV